MKPAYAASLLVALLTGGADRVFAQGSSSTLTDQTTAKYVVTLAIAEDAKATIGGVGSSNSATFRGTGDAKANVEYGAALAIAKSTARIGGVYLSTARGSGTLRADTNAKFVAALGIAGGSTATIGTVEINNTTFNGTVTTKTNVQFAAAMAVLGMQTRIGGVVIE